MEEREKEAERERIQREDEEERARLFEEARARIEPLIPEVLRPYADYTQLSTWPGVRSQRVLFLDVPGCSQVQATFSRIEDGWRMDPAWQVQVLDEGHSEMSQVETRYVGVAGLEKAWAMAAIAAERIASWEVGIASWEAQNEANRERYQEEEEIRAMEYRVERKAQDAELERLVDVVRADPVAATLLRLFIAVQDERALVRERMEGLDETMSSIEERHRQRLEAAERELSRTQADLEEERRRARDAEDEAARTRKDARRGSAW